MMLGLIHQCKCHLQDDVDQNIVRSHPCGVFI